MTDTTQMPASKMFAEFGIRMAAVGFDFFIVIFLMEYVRTYILDPVGLGSVDNRFLVHAVLFLYFTVFWASPLCATPVQFLFAMRVVDERGEKLSLAYAALRSAALTAQIVAIYFLFSIPVHPLLAILAAAAVVAVFLAAVTPNRQAGHDFLARSMVVNKMAINSPTRLARLLEHASDRDAATFKRRRPTIVRMIMDLIVFAVPIVVLSIFAGVMNDKDMSYRTNYAFDGVTGLKFAIEEFYLDAERWPTNEQELGAATRGDYPDGGYYELEDKGVIRIHFTVKPQLMKGTIVLKPVVDHNGVTWTCHAEGDIAQSHLPSRCRY